MQLALSRLDHAQNAAWAGWQIDAIERTVDTYLPRNRTIALGRVETGENSDNRVITLAIRRH